MQRNYHEEVYLFDLTLPSVFAIIPATKSNEYRRKVCTKNRMRSAAADKKQAETEAMAQDGDKVSGYTATELYPKRAF